jgi:hypothetical protein
MDSVPRAGPTQALDLSFHSTEFDVFIQAQQANYKSDGDPTAGFTPSTANYAKIKPGRSAPAVITMALIRLASSSTE